MFFKIIQQLKQRGVLGINQRNLDFVLGYNHKSRMRLADDKLLTKQLALTANIPVPAQYGVIEAIANIGSFEKIVQPYNDFVIKPIRGSGGKGILIIKEKIKHKFRLSNDKIMTLDQIEEHISKILSGVFSLGGYADSTLIEYRVKSNPVFDSICYKGVPDTRIVVWRGYPIMAMLRLPTIESNGKANLHQGAIGVGIDLAHGITLDGIAANEIITEHPDTLQPLKGIQIPFWQEMLLIAANCFELTQLGYLGVDLVLDAERGPLLLELNARPGLNIQLANQQGFLQRAQQLMQHINVNQETVNAEQRVALSQTLFKAG
ncbi:MAG: alpha-L-glutamate ligase-like protein [Gammaproteobacteria bacterium]